MLIVSFGAFAAPEYVDVVARSSPLDRNMRHWNGRLEHGHADHFLMNAWARNSPETYGDVETRAQAMKKVEASIKPFQLDAVQDALAAVAIQGMTVTEVKGFGRTGAKKEVYRKAACVVDFVPKVKLEIVVPDHLAQNVVDAIDKSATTGRIGDGKIFVSSVDEALRIRTAERGDDAM